MGRNQRVGLFAEGKAADFDFFTCKDAFSLHTAAGYSNFYGIRTVVEAGNKVVTNTSPNGGWFMISGVETGDRAVSAVELTVAAKAAGKLEIWLDDLQQGTPAATVPVTETGGDDQWKTFSVPVGKFKGHHDVFIKYPAGEAGVIYIRSVRFIKMRRFGIRDSGYGTKPIIMRLKTIFAYFPCFVVLASALYSYGQGKTPPVSITVNLLQDQGNPPPIWAFFGYDEANYTYMKDGKKLLTELAALSPVRVNVRTHNLLTSGNGTPGLKWSSTNAYTEDANGNPIYDWKVIDSIFDTYVQRGMKPIAEIGFMPEAMSITPGPVSEQDTSGKINPRHYSGWAYPPKNYEKWAELIFQWVKHSVRRYGKAEVENWYWEVWNEPDLTFYWKGNADDYIKLYDYTADAVKRALPAAKIGGPETTSPDGKSGEEYIRKFLNHIVSGTNYVTGKKGAPIDFISFHAKGSPKLIDGVVWMNMGKQLKTIDKGFEIVSSVPSLKNLPIIIGESDPEGCAACSEDLHPENAYRNNTMYACYTAAAIARTYDLAKKWGVNLAGAVTWGFEFEDQPYFRGFRDLATNGIDKPVLNAFRMLGMMEGSRVATESTSKQDFITIRDSSVRGPEPDVNALATKSINAAAVMVWNYHDKNDLSVASTDVSIIIQGLPQQRVLLTQYIIDQEHSNSFTAWKKMGSPKEPTAEEYETLEAAGQLEEISSPKYITPVNGEVNISFDLQRQAITLIKVTW